MVDIRTELLIDGEWADVTGDVLNRDPLTITRGRRDESSRAEPSRLQLTLNNEGGKYSLRNPMSPLYGKLSRNTQIRVSVPGETYYSQPDDNFSMLSTPSSTALDITEDLDFRIEITPDQLPMWRDGERQVSTLAGRYNANTEDRSWRLVLDGNGYPWVAWTTVGTDFHERGATVPIPHHAGERFALRVTMDVDNGAGGYTLTFYSAPSIAGPWTPFGDPIIGDAPTSIHNPTVADLDIGTLKSIIWNGLPGQYHAFELRDGIDGPLLANPILADQEHGAESFNDAQGNVWSLAANGAISNRHYRFHGEVSEWPTVWGTGGTDMHASITASGITRRLTQNQKSSPSALRLHMPTTGLVGYWPMEEPPGATSTTGYGADGEPLGTGVEVSGIDFGTENSLAGSAALPTVARHAILHGLVPEYDSDGYTLSMLIKPSSLPSTAKWVMKGITESSGYDHFRFLAGQDKLRLEIVQDDGDNTWYVETSSPAILSSWESGDWLALTLYSGVRDGETYVTAFWRELTSGRRWYLSVSRTGTHPAKLTAWRMNLSPDWRGMGFGHLAVYPFGGNWSTDLDPDGFMPDSITLPLSAARGFPGDYAGWRMIRLSHDEQIPFALSGFTGDTERLGPQPMSTYMDGLEDAAKVDGGILYEDRHALRIRYRTRPTLYGQRPAASLPYGGKVVAPPLLPVDDDQATRNDVTATSPGGGSARAVEESGPMSVQPPPLGAGRYSGEESFNVYVSEQLYPLAGHQVALGTVDAPRFPDVVLRLHADPELARNAMRLDVGDRLDLTGMPPWMPDETTRLLVQGYTERLSLTEWEITANCSPYEPWHSTDVDSEDQRVDTEWSGLNASVTDSETDLIVYSEDLPWITSEGAAETFSDEFPFTVQSEGEHMEVSAVRPYVYDAFDRPAAPGLWGASSGGEEWAYSGGFAEDYRLTGSAGAVAVPGDGTIRFAWLPQIVEDTNLLMSVTPTQMATGAQFLTGPILRLNGSMFYWFVISFSTSGRVLMQIANGTTTVIPGVPSRYTYSAGQKFWVRAEVKAGHVRGRIWPDGHSEPADWFAEGDIGGNPSPAGFPGLLTLQTTAGTNTGAELIFDDFEVQNPQRFTVTRGVNGVTKPHPLAAPISLADPATVTL